MGLYYPTLFIIFLNYIIIFLNFKYFSQFFLSKYSFQIFFLKNFSQTFLSNFIKNYLQVAFIFFNNYFIKKDLNLSKKLFFSFSFVSSLESSIPSNNKPINTEYSGEKIFVFTDLNP